MDHTIMSLQSLDIASAESLLAFWRDAGVDACFEDAPVDRTHVEPPPVRKAMLKATAAVVAAPDAGECAHQARALAVEAMTMQALAAAAEQFDGCGLKQQGAQRAVVGAGPDAPALLVIGNAPGEAEDRSGQVFDGPAGRLFDKMLAEAGLADRTFKMNSVFWRPPGDRPPAPEEQAACLPFLERALMLLKPHAVLLLGAAPARAVLGVGGNVMGLRGEWRDWRLAEGGLHAPTLITLNPAFLLKQPQAKKAAWADLLAVAARLDNAGDVQPASDSKPPQISS